LPAGAQSSSTWSKAYGAQRDGIAGGPAEYEPALGDCTLYTSTSYPASRVLIGALMLGIPERKLRVVAPDVGGGFGSKQVFYAEEGLVTWATRKLGRPLKWVADRSEAFQSDAQGRDHVTHAELAVDQDGGFLALRVSTLVKKGPGAAIRLTQRKPCG
jgi:aerobic carbon-monoxide dehydrogenase large subunit